MVAMYFEILFFAKKKKKEKFQNLCLFTVNSFKTIYHRNLGTPQTWGGVCVLQKEQ